MAFLHCETNWPCVSPHGQKSCEGTLIVVDNNDGYSVCCNKCSLGVTGNGNLPDFWITKLIEEGYLKQLRRRPVEKKALSQVLRNSDWFTLSLQEVVDLIYSKFEVFYRDGD